MEWSRPTNGVGPTFIAVLAVMATGAFGRTVSPEPSPSDPPTARPSDQPTATPTTGPTTEPSGDFRLHLDIATAHDVTVVIADETGSVANAVTGRAADGMSVRWHDVKVENVDDDTLRVTWVGLPVDEVIHLAVTSDGDGYRFAFTEKLPYPNTDAMGGDRVLIFDFTQPVSADDVTASFAD